MPQHEVKWSLRQSPWAAATNVFNTIRRTNAIICAGYHSRDKCPQGDLEFDEQNTKHYFKKLFSKEPEEITLSQIELKGWLEENSGNLLKEENRRIKVLDKLDTVKYNKLYQKVY
jgi:hypothetical protein